MLRKKTKRPRHMLAISFFVTFFALAGVYSVFYVSVLTPHIDVGKLPQSIPPYTSFWASYVPANALQFGFQNYTKVRSLNSSFPPEITLLQLVKPPEAINTSQVNYFLDITFAQPNASMSIVFMNSQDYLNFQAPLQTLVGYGEEFENATLYSVAVSPGSSPVLGWLALIPHDRAVAFAAGASDAKQILELSLDSAAHPSKSVLSRTDVTTALYIVGGVADHVGVGEQNFPGVVSSGLMTVTAVDSVGQLLYVKNVVAFENSAAAMAHYSDVHKGFPGAQQFTVYDSFVLAQEADPLSKLGGDYRIVL